MVVARQGGSRAGILAAGRENAGLGLWGAALEREPVV